MTPGRPHSLLDFLALKRGLVGLLGVIVLVGMGERLGERFLPLYLSDLLKSSLSPESAALWAGYAIGFFGLMKNLVPAIYSHIGGWMAEKTNYQIKFKETHFLLTCSL